MTARGQQVLKDVLFAAYALFVFASVLSIAFAQIGLGLSIGIFLIGQVWWRANPFVGKLRPLYWAILAYIVWLLIAAAVSPDFMVGLNDMRGEWLFAAVPIGVFLLAERRYRRPLIVIFVIGVGMIALYGIIQHFTGVYWFKKVPPLPAGDDTYRIFGGFSTRITFGNYLATAAVFILTWTLLRFWDHPLWLRVSGLVATSFATLATVWTYSRGSLASIFVALGLAALTAGWKRAVGLIGLLILVLITLLVAAPQMADRIVTAGKNDLNPNYEGGRPYIWRHSIDMALEHPIFGVGPGFFPPNYAKRLPPDIADYRKLPHAHNDSLHLMAAAGIPGAVTFLAIWVILARLLWRGYRSGDDEVRAYSGAALAASAAFFFTSLFEATFVDEEVRQMLMFAWAVGLWPWYKQVIENTPDSERS